MEAALTPRIGCVILAAGAGRRFGGAKLLARFDGGPLLQTAIDAACGSAALTCTLVLGAHAAAVLSGVDARRCSVAFNDRWRSGMASSLRRGLREHLDDDACIIALGDQPFVTSADLDLLMSTWTAQRLALDRGASGRRKPPIVALCAGDVWGSPVLFPRADFAALHRLMGDRGAKKYAASQNDRLAFAPGRDPRAFVDVDTAADLRRLISP